MAEVVQSQDNNSSIQETIREIEFAKLVEWNEKLSDEQIKHLAELLRFLSADVQVLEVLKDKYYHNTLNICINQVQDNHDVKLLNFFKRFANVRQENLPFINRLGYKTLDNAVSIRLRKNPIELYASFVKCISGLYRETHEKLAEEITKVVERTIEKTHKKPKDGFIVVQKMEIEEQLNKDYMKHLFDSGDLLKNLEKRIRKSYIHDISRSTLKNERKRASSEQNDSVVSPQKSNLIYTDILMDNVQLNEKLIKECECFINECKTYFNKSEYYDAILKQNIFRNNLPFRGETPEFWTKLIDLLNCILKEGDKENV